jgi:DNA-binding transcriptional ArsR family regulator
MEATTIDTALQIEDLKIKKAALVLRAINHPLRQQMLHLLHHNKQMMVTSIYVKLRLEQSVASQQLAILRRANLVITNRDGKCIYYAVNYDRLAEVQSIAAQLISQ